MTNRTLTLEQFRATRQRSENLSEISGGAFDDGAAYVYEGGAYIAILPDGSLYLTMIQEEHAGSEADRPKLEERLYKFCADEGYFRAPPAERVSPELAEQTILTALRVAAEIYDEHMAQIEQPLVIRKQFERQAKEARATLAQIEDGALLIERAKEEA
jgi:hypothetical protein